MIPFTVWGYLTLSFAAVGADDFPDLTKFNLQQLVRMDVTSVSKRPEPWFESPAAVYVITGEDIRRSGVTTIAEALRMAPGVNVARNDASTWAVGVRGFNDVFNSKLLVLIDGRTVNSPFTGGVEWDVRDIPLEDIDRIEVIRGPGGTLWGANAVNGVINIITKDARDTQGWLVSAGGGTEDQAFTSVRYGGKLDGDVAYRVWGKWFVRDDSVLTGGGDAADNWWQSRGGFRADWERGADNRFLLEGEVYQGVGHQNLDVAIATAPFVRSANYSEEVTGGNLLGRWTHSYANGAESQLQTYYLYNSRERGISPRQTRQVVDLEAQHRFNCGDRQTIVAGLNYQLADDDMDNSFAVSFHPAADQTHWFGGFVQDEIVVVPERLHLTLGTKLDHNEFTGWEVQPSGRLAWTPTARQTAWASVSRAVGTPTRQFSDIRINLPIAPGVPAVASVLGNPEAGSEDLIAYELGYRFAPQPRLYCDVTAFYNDYRNVRSLRPVTPPPVAVAAFEVANTLKAESYGVEAAATQRKRAAQRVAEAVRVTLPACILPRRCDKLPA